MKRKKNILLLGLLLISLLPVSALAGFRPGNQINCSESLKDVVDDIELRIKLSVDRVESERGGRRIIFIIGNPSRQSSWQRIEDFLSSGVLLKAYSSRIMRSCRNINHINFFPSNAGPGPGDPEFARFPDGSILKCSTPFIPMGENRAITNPRLPRCPN